MTRPMTSLMIALRLPRSLRCVAVPQACLRLGSLIDGVQLLGMTGMTQVNPGVRSNASWSLE